MIGTRTNPFQRYYNICHTGTGHEKLKNLPDFPRLIDIELTNLCNFKCRMCPVGKDELKRKQGYMTGNVFRIILNQIRPYNTPIRFVRWGEPTLHPSLIEFIKLAKLNDLLVHINTNGYFVDDKLIESFIDLPLDSIKFSFQGYDRKTYEKWRGIDYYGGLILTITRLHEKRGDREKPFITAGTTVERNDGYEWKKGTEFYKSLSHFCDYVYIGITRDLGKPPKMYKECPEVFDKLSINWDGTVTACCGDYDNKMLVGDIKEKHLKEIWVSHKLQHYRKKLADMKHAELELCRNCAR